MTTFLHVAITGPCGRTVICESTPGLLLIQHLPADPVHVLGILIIYNLFNN